MKVSIESDGEFEPKFIKAFCWLLVVGGIAACGSLTGFIISNFYDLFVFLTA